MSEQSPSDVVREVFALLEQERWSEIPAFIHPRWLRQSHDERLAEAHSHQTSAPVSAEQIMHGVPDMPLVVAQWNADRLNAQRGEPRFYDVAGVETLEELERLTPEEMLARRIQAADHRYRRDAVVAESQPQLAELDLDADFPRKTVIGDVIAGKVAYVVFSEAYTTSPFRVISLIRTSSGWKLENATPFLDYNTDFSTLETMPEDPPLRLASVPQILWVSRTFDHRLSPEHFPAVLERFRGAPARVSELTTLRSIRLAKPDGKWSIQEHLGHLLDLEELGEQRLRDYHARVDRLSAADMTNRKTDEAGHNQAEWSDLLERFRAAREALCRKLEGLPPEIIAHAAEHPRLKRPMNVPEWVFFMCEHDDHHLLRMRELVVTHT